MKTVQWFINEYRNAHNTYSWPLLDEAIFSTVRKYPLHDDVSSAYAKVVLINRVYRANIQMCRKGAEDLLALGLVKEADSLINPLSTLRVFNKESSDIVVDVHNNFVKLIQRSVRTNWICNSFASKYLNFHYPQIVPIFDSNAYSTAWELVGDRLPRGLYMDRANRDFCIFCAYVLELADELRSQGIKHINIKFIDAVLHGKAQ